MIVPCGHPFGTEAPADHLGRGFFLNSSQIFPSSKGFPQRLSAMKGGSDGAPSPSPVPALGTRSPAPPCGASLFLYSPSPRRRSPRWGEGASGNPPLRRRVIQAEDRPTPPGPKDLAAGPESCVSVPEAPALPRGFFVVAPHSDPLDLTCPLESIVIRQRAEEAMPGDPKECREHARRCAELAKARDHAGSARAVPLAANVLDQARSRSRQRQSLHRRA